MNRLAVLCLLVVSLGCSGGETITARLDDARGLEAGDKVLVAGIEVGRVKSVSVVDGFAQVEMELAERQDVALHHGACAHATSLDGEGAIEVRPGAQGEMEGDVLPACPQSLVDRAVELQNEMLEAASSGAREAARRLTKTAAEVSAGLNDGSDNLRETGRNLGMAGQAFAEGVEEGVQ